MSSAPLTMTRRTKTWTIPVDPAALAINPQMGKRYKDKGVMRAQDEIAWEVRNDRPDWPEGAAGGWRLWLVFRFRSYASDVDGPIKRVLDALAIGLNPLVPFNDRDVIDLRMQKRIVRPDEEPHVIIHLEAL